MSIAEPLTVLKSELLQKIVPSSGPPLQDRGK